MAVVFGNSYNAVFRIQIYPQNREAEYSYLTGDKYHLMLKVADPFDLRQQINAAMPSCLKCNFFNN
ncbi:hypothetical protein AU255_14165 [Methyloprofundus sedimenti]|uniref:Uncharacterized protein n=1 Tax=Methyloprofundus sedimenti TaxID=1420851 RepID=A0A1V8M3U0_9GAMM|nr:hypothetical protein AU255_14165 [Methyloprofundus sedimenti]